MALRGIAGSTEVADSIDGAGAANTTVSSSYDDASKKIRKPYTIKKSRESWTEQEHDHFLEALQLFDRDWKKIEAFIGSKTTIQIRSHAQKYFLKVQKNGTGEHVPPPRPKRKASHPYPQKAPKNDSSSETRKSITTAVPCSSGFCCVLPDSVSQLAKEELCPSGATVAGNCSSVSAESRSGTWQNSESINQGDNAQLLQVTPDFEQVYSFLGSVFDPSSRGHLQKLKEMNPVDVETVLLLMKNVAVNLISSNFNSYIKLLSSYKADGDAEEVKSVASPSLAGNVVNAPFMLESS